jgi:hypothetical protein
MTRSLVKDFIETLNGLDHSKDRYTKFPRLPHPGVLRPGETRGDVG